MRGRKPATMIVGEGTPKKEMILEGPQKERRVLERKG